jgi:hypothetical protein
MAESGADEHTWTDCGVTITGVPVVPAPGGGPTPAQIEKLKPTVYLCAESAKEHGRSFNETAIGRKREQTPRQQLPESGRVRVRVCRRARGLQASL